MITRIYFCAPFREVEMKVFKGPDPKIKNPKKPKKGGKKWPKKK